VNTGVEGDRSNEKMAHFFQSKKLRTIARERTYLESLGWNPVEERVFMDIFGFRTPFHAYGYNAIKRIPGQGWEDYVMCRVNMRTNYYNDHMFNDDTVRYQGSGLEGDQRMRRNNNHLLENPGTRVLLCTRLGDSTWYYKFGFRSGAHEYVAENDRNVFYFRIKVV
jgi:hypothetical protein